jgi:hypothetical protein
VAAVVEFVLEYVLGGDMRLAERERLGSMAIGVLTAEALVYEFWADDVLSFATKRMVKRHPVLARLVILAISGHLADVVPWHIDLFDARNPIHRAIVIVIRDLKRRIRCRGTSQKTIPDALAASLSPS